jgi:hypothetical protein
VKKKTTILASTMTLGLVLAACSSDALAAGIVAQFPDRFAA